MHHKTTILIAPSLQNSSCSHPRYAAQQTLIGFLTALTVGDVLQATVIFLLTTGILCANMMLIIVINSRRYVKYIHSQPRYLLTSLASIDFAIGLLVTPLAIVPSVRHCWPFGELVCQIQALLRVALSQQSAVILICMAMDRYACMLHPARYHKHSSKKGCFAIISLTGIVSVTLFSVLVLQPGGYYFNPTGMMSCEPFYSRPSFRILAACCFYFPTTMILMYCYGSAFHVNKLRLKRNGACNTIATQDDFTGISVEKLVTQERRLSTSASRTMAAMSLGFIVLVTPWSIQEVVAACTGTRAPPALDFLATWLALSNAFWNPFLYWLLNNHFRRICKDLLMTKLFCQKLSPDLTIKSSSQQCCSNSSLSSNRSCPGSGSIGPSSTNNSTTIPPLPPSACRAENHEGFNEKYWGEILERTLSSNSLQALQKVYSGNTSSGSNNPSSNHVHNHHIMLSTQHRNHSHHHHQHYIGGGHHSAKCNGTMTNMLQQHHGGSHHEMRVFDNNLGGAAHHHQPNKNTINNSVPDL